MAAKLRCFIHDAANNSDDIKTFTNEAWGKVKIAKQYRLSKPFWLTSKYADVCMNIPDDLSVNDGYHSDCYKNFTAVGNITKYIETCIPKRQVFLRSEADVSSDVDSSSAGDRCVTWLHHRRFWNY